MTQTARTNLIIPEILTDSIRTGLAGLTALLGTGAAIVNNSLPSDKQGGDVVSIPYFNAMGKLDEVAEGAPLVPRQLTTDKETAAVARAGIALDLTRWARMAAAGDPYAEASRQFVDAASRYADEKLILAAKTTDLVADDSTVNFSYDGFVEAKQEFGDEIDNIAIVVMHSAVYGKLLKLKDGNSRPLIIDAITSGDAPRFLGVPVKVSDRLAPDGDVYSTLIVKKAALVFWFNGQPSIRGLPDVLKDSDLTSLNLYGVAYRYRNMPGLSKSGVVLYKHK